MIPNKFLGQHFLKSLRPVLLMIQAAKEEPPVEVVLEIGPGKGTLTRALCRAFKKVVAIEKDPRLAEDLKRNFEIEEIKNCEIITGDILKTDTVRTIGEQSYAVIANIPYYLTSRLIRNFLETKHQPAYMILMVQKEVGERIIAKPPDMNLLALSVQAYGKPKIIAEIPRKEFAPEPNVDSGIVKISDISRKFFLKGNTNEKQFFVMLHAGFSQKRKQIGNTLSAFFHGKTNAETLLLQTGISPKHRPQELSLDDWGAVFRLWRQK